MNGVNKAIKFTLPGAVDPITITARQRGPATLVIEVADRGPGLRGRSIDRVTSEYDVRQGGGTGGEVEDCPPPPRRTRLSGIRSSGLGVPICMRLAELMGGTVTLADRVDGPGAVFTLTLPLRSPAGAEEKPVPATMLPPGPAAASSSALQGAAASPARTDSASFVLPFVASPPAALATRELRAGETAAAAIPRGTRVLAVDDSPANLRFAAFLLRRLGCIVTTASDGDEVPGAVAAAVALGAPFDVCVMDMHMERVNGDAALAGLRAAGSALPVVLSTANATHGDAARYAAMGFASQLAKPFSPEQLRDALAAALQQTRQV